jgi:sialate O-acetylesterase
VAIASPETVKDFSAVAYFFGRKINEATKVPIGLINTSYGASTVEAWMDEQTLSVIKKIELANEIPKERPQQSPTLLYNGMLYPLQGYTIKGFIWYQGEGNSEVYPIV